jgi:DNA replication and repair protein RecF
MCKSYFTNTDVYSIHDKTDFMVLQAKFLRENKTEELYCGLKQAGRKQFRRNKKEYNRLSDHIGLFPVVMVSPSDNRLISEGSEERRKYINGVISQYDRTYLEDTISYQRILVQRNKLLKDIGNNSMESELLDVFDGQLVEYGTAIHKKRIEFIEQFIPVFNRFYQFISGGSEPVGLIYQSQLTGFNFLERLRSARQRDLFLKYTTVGIHKDDLIMNLMDEPIKLLGSQGQQKTYLISMKFAQFEFLYKLKGFPPLLLLDDVFDKLDVHRVRKILELVNENSFGQIFITHTNLDRMKIILDELKIEHTLFQISNGSTKLIEN